MKKIVFPINERDYFTTNGRICYWLRSLAQDYQIELWTQSQEVYDHAEKALLDVPNASALMFKSTHHSLTFEFRDNLAKIFVKFTENIHLPGSDLSVWKTCAFDDFWGHITSLSVPGIEKLDADCVMLPLMSFDDSPWEETDVFYTSIAFSAKDRGARLLGYQLYPVFNGMKLMTMLMDGIIVRKEYEKRYYLQAGIEPDKIHLLTEPRDVYASSTIEDSYENHLFNSQIPIGRDELSIVVCNHGKFRPLIREIFRVIEETGIPIVLNLLKREFVVRELMEDQIIEKLYYDDIKRINCRFFLVENKSLVPIMMVSDIIISPTYIIPLEFAGRYRKKAWIYNPYTDWDEDINGVRFIKQAEDLSRALVAAYREKKAAIGIRDILQSVLEEVSVSS